MDAHRTEVAESVPDAEARPYDLEVIERACRSFAAIMERDIQKIDNSTVRGPVERMARHAAELTEGFAKARTLAVPHIAHKQRFGSSLALGRIGTVPHGRRLRVALAFVLGGSIRAQG